MSILGIDLSTKSIDLVLLDNDTNAASWIAVPIKDKRGAFNAARNVRDAMRYAHIDREVIWLVGIEDSMYRSAQTIRALARVQGAVLACLPRGVEVMPLTSHEWKRETVGKAMADKDAVRAWATYELCPGPDPYEGWSQDGYDAYCIARAARALNERAAAA